MSNLNPFEGASTEFLAAGAPEITLFQEFLDQHRVIIATATLMPSLLSKDELLDGYRELYKTFSAVITAGQMAMEAELITRDLSDINPDN